MEAFTYHLMWVAAAIYSAELAPEGLRATMIGAVGGLHYGIGRASGSMIGGTMMALIGGRLAFRFLGIGAGVAAVFYTIYYYGYLRKSKPVVSISETPEETLAEKTTRKASIDCKATFTSGTPDTVKVQVYVVPLQVNSGEESVEIDEIKPETSVR